MGNGKKLLLVCNYFAPENTIAAVRLSNLARYMIKMGYEVTILTEKKEYRLADETLTEDIDMSAVMYADNSKWCRSFCIKYKKFIKPHKEKRFQDLSDREKVNPKTGHVEFYTFEELHPLIASLDYLTEQIRQRNLAKNARKLIEDKEYDILLTSYGDSFSYFFGRRYKRKHPGIFWVFDIRDAICRYKFTPKYVKRLPKSYEQYIWQHTEAIVGISKGICERVPEKYREKVHYISNGYNRYQGNGKTERLMEKMVFVYTGSMYGGLQNLSKFFEAVKSLIQEGSVQEDRLAFCFAGNESAYGIFKSQAGRYHLGSLCVYYGKLTRKESMDLQRSADILLLATYDYKDHIGGVITGKLLEYMDAGKPVIAVITGDIEKSEAAEIVKKTNIGISYEQSNDAEDFRRLKGYIKDQYERYLNCGKTLYEPVAKEVEAYDYRNIVKRYAEVLEGSQRGR